MENQEQKVWLDICDLQMSEGLHSKEQLESLREAPQDLESTVVEQIFMMPP